MKKILVIITLIAFSSALYSQDAKEIKVKELPAKVTAWIKQNFPKATMDKAVKFTDKKVVVGISVVVDINGRKMIQVFDKDGNYLERVRKMAEVEGILKPAQPKSQPDSQPQPARK